MPKTCWVVPVFVAYLPVAYFLPPGCAKTVLVNHYGNRSLQGPVGIGGLKIRWRDNPLDPD